MKHCNEIEGIDMIVPDMPKKQQLITALSQISNLYITSSESYYIEMPPALSAKPLPCMRWLRSFILPRNKLWPLETVITTSSFYLMPDAVSQWQNATSNLLKAASAVTRSNNEDGVAFYLESFL